MIVSNTGYWMFGKQTARASATTPSISIPYTEDTSETTHDLSEFRNDENILLDISKNRHGEPFGFSVFARPDLTAYLLGYLLGADSVAGGADPYTHTMTYLDQGRPYLTLERHLKEDLTQRFIDGKIETITINGQAGMPLTISVSGNACNTAIITSNRTPNYDTKKIFMFYHSSGNFSLDGSTTTAIKGFSVGITLDSVGGQIGDDILAIDYPDVNFNIAFNAELYMDDETIWKGINYNSGTSPSETVKTGSFEFDCQYNDGLARQFKITIPKVYYSGVTGVVLGAEGNVITNSIAGIAAKQATTEIITCTIKNSVSTDII